MTDKLKVVREQVSCEGDSDDGAEAGEEVVEEVEVITRWFSYKVSIIGWECLFLVSAENQTDTPPDLWL